MAIIVVVINITMIIVITTYYHSISYNNINENYNTIDIGRAARNLRPRASWRSASRAAARFCAISYY